MVNKPIIPLDIDDDDFNDDQPSLTNISVYNLPVYRHTGLFQDTEPVARPEHRPQSSKLLFPIACVIIFVLVFYGFLLSQGIPQKWTESVNAPTEAHDVNAPAEEAAEDSAPVEATEEVETTEKVETTEESVKEHPCPSIVMIAPFAGLLLCIAFLPLLPATAYWWEHNTNKFLVATSLGAVTLLYYYFGCHFPVEGHWPGHSVVDPAVDGGFAVVKTVFANAIMSEFIPFIVLLFSLFVITGGIRISGNFKGTPFINTVILAVGALLASFIGTTGAAMLLIRLLLEINRRRKYRVHTVILFIFTVCNAGGCLTPLGDPPLFLGYLRGVPFEWTLLHLWPAWLFLNVVLLIFYFFWDSWFYQRESYRYRQRGMTSRVRLLVAGWGVNVPLLLGVVASVAFLAPNKPFMGYESCHPPYYLREAVQLGLAAVSLLVGRSSVRRKNAFNFLAIGEVAALFFGIFICMQAPLQIINVEGKNMVTRVEEKTGLGKEMLFFWTTGSLSLVLDNAPTYVVFFETAKTLSPGLTEEEAREAWKATGSKRELDLVRVGKSGFIDNHLLIAVALGTIFMGGMTYIANGPNFMVKAIADCSGIKMPSFFGFMVYSCVILLPAIILTSLFFL
ncbi:MAG: sodium:proton antiporter [Planctomycetaceae bacterium]|nr:sodium:proton antiporter [Planctomycetaceae bacterium]